MIIDSKVLLLKETYEYENNRTYKSIIAVLSLHMCAPARVHVRICVSVELGQFHAAKLETLPQQVHHVLLSLCH